ncbi:MAG: hypothetical protein FWD13_11910 [Treponema sp.]|nr:hypothetical protein [Treponema sp.]
MKKITGIIFLAVFIFAGCPSFESIEVIDTIKIFAGGTETNSITIETGETITLTSETNGSPQNVSIVWEPNNTNMAIVSSGEGAECIIRGMIPGSSVLTVKAWRSPNDTPAVQTIFISVTEPKITDISFNGPVILGIGEEKPLSFEIIPEWANNVPVLWSATSNVSLVGNILKGINNGQATLTAAAGSFTKDFIVEIKQPDNLESLSVYKGNENITGQIIQIGLYEELQLSAVIAPSSAFTFYTWSSDAPEYVSITPDGLIKGIKTTANNTPVTIKVNASNQEKEFYVEVKNPVTGIRIMFDNDEELPVINTIWLYPGEELKLKVELAPEGIDGIITWTGANNEVTLSANGGHCTITGGNITRFDAVPTELRITARNNDNGEKYVSTIVRVKTQSKPIWAWDRGRDGGLRNNGIPVVNDAGRDYYTMASASGDTGMTLTGRGEYSGTNLPLKVGGNPNTIRWTNLGMLINSSNSSGGLNPNPAPNPGNSTRMAIGTNSADSTINGHQPGVLNFAEIEEIIRISVDYEIIWTAGAGRNLWIMVNNNQANAMQSVLGTSSQILIHPLTAPRGTRATAVATINAADFIFRKIPGHESLNTSFISIVCLSNGGSIYVSGIRIEKD